MYVRGEYMPVLYQRQPDGTLLSEIDRGMPEMENAYGHYARTDTLDLVPLARAAPWEHINYCLVQGIGPAVVHQTGFRSRQMRIIGAIDCRAARQFLEISRLPALTLAQARVLASLSAVPFDIGFWEIADAHVYYQGAKIGCEYDNDNPTSGWDWNECCLVGIMTGKVRKIVPRPNHGFREEQLPYIRLSEDEELPFVERMLRC